jgi:hypothetical protein
MRTMSTGPSENAASVSTVYYQLGGGCSADKQGTLTSNDNSAGTLTVGFTSTVNLAFPIIITCSFAEVAGQTLSTSDIATSVDQAGLAASATVT